MYASLVMLGATGAAVGWGWGAVGGVGGTAVVMSLIKVIHTLVARRNGYNKLSSENFYKVTDEQMQKMMETPKPVREIHKAVMDPVHGMVVLQHQTVEKIGEISKSQEATSQILAGIARN